MRRILALCTLALVPALLCGEEKKDEKKSALPNTLTKEEIKAGWLLLFDGETTFGWEIDGEAKVEKGVLILGGEKETKASVATEFANYGIKVRLDVTGKKAADISVGGTRGKYGETQNAGIDTGLIGVSDAGSPIKVVAPAGTQVRIRSAMLQPARFDKLFNGKDLTGWKVFTGDKKREKSQFTVTKEGHLNVKDGPGDIQTEKTFADFVLQLECISNGKHLNSGIFFRAIPGDYWQGYEAQIRNEFTDKPTQKYAIESFDPKSHKSLGKKDVLSTAVDYGTGAIYRRVPARKAVSKDNEWFTLTVVARGRHFATWVNGVQQVDWTDNREPGKNGRNNYRAEAGAISIQGHDKTTDLSFRNIRIAELKRAKK